MDGFFFAYTLAVLAVCLVSTVLQAMAWSVKRSRAFVAAGWFFSAYFVELGVIFLDEHLHQNVVFPTEAYYAVTYPVARAAIACMLWGSLWAWVLTAVDAYSRKRLLWPVTLFAAAQVACLALLPYGALRQFLFYTCRQVFCAAMGLFAWRAWRAAPTDEQRAWMGRHRRLLLFFMVGVALTVAEDSLVILVMEPAKSGGAAPLPLRAQLLRERAHGGAGRGPGPHRLEGDLVPPDGHARGTSHPPHRRCPRHLRPPHRWPRRSPRRRRPATPSPTKWTSSCRALPRPTVSRPGSARCWGSCWRDAPTSRWPTPSWSPWAP